MGIREQMVAEGGGTKKRALFGRFAFQSNTKQMSHAIGTGTHTRPSLCYIFSILIFPDSRRGRVDPRSGNRLSRDMIWRSAFGELRQSPTPSQLRPNIIAHHQPFPSSQLHCSMLRSSINTSETIWKDKKERAEGLQESDAVRRKRPRCCNGRASQGSSLLAELLHHLL